MHTTLRVMPESFIDVSVPRRFSLIRVDSLIAIATLQKGALATLSLCCTSAASDSVMPGNGAVIADGVAW